MDTDISRLVDVMHRLLDDPDLARRIGASGQKLVQERFGIDRFARDWETIFTDVCG